jgi:hypothetical protein
MVVSRSLTSTISWLPVVVVVLELLAAMVFRVLAVETAVRVSPRQSQDHQSPTPVVVVVVRTRMLTHVQPQRVDQAVAVTQVLVVRLTPVEMAQTVSVAVAVGPRFLADAAQTVVVVAQAS